MERRQFLRLGAVASGVFALGGISRVARGTGAAQTLGVPTVERLVMTNGVDNVYDAFARGGKLKPGVTLYAGGEDTFCHRIVVTPAGSVDYGTLDRSTLEARGLKVVLAKQPAVVTGHAFVTGEIARVTDFEKPPAAARLVAGPMDSACAASHFGATKVEAKSGDLVADTFQGEHATVYHVKDRGLVVITSCGH